MNTSAQSRAQSFSPSLLEHLRVELKHLAELDSEVVTAALSTVDGFQISRAGPAESLDPARLAAMTSSLAALGTAVGEELDNGGLDCVLVESEFGRILVLLVPLGPRSVILAAVTAKEVLLGKVLATCREFARRMETAYSLDADVDNAR